MVVLLRLFLFVVVCYLWRYSCSVVLIWIACCSGYWIALFVVLWILLCLLYFVLVYGLDGCCLMFVVLLELLMFVVMLTVWLCFGIIVFTVWLFACYLGCVICVLIVLLICVAIVAAFSDWFWLVLFWRLVTFVCWFRYSWLWASGWFCLAFLLLWFRICCFVGLYCGLCLCLMNFDLNLWFVVWCL